MKFYKSRQFLLYCMIVSIGYRSKTILSLIQISEIKFLYSVIEYKGEDKIQNDIICDELEMFSLDKMPKHLFFYKLRGKRPAGRLWKVDLSY